MSRPAAVLAVVVALMAVSMSPAGAAATVTKAELNGSRLRLEGTAIANRTITVDGVAMGTSDGAGTFRIDRDPYLPPADCTVDVRDGSAEVTVVRLVGCSTTSTSDTTAPTVPAGLTATLSGSTANLAWSPSTDSTGVTGYRVTRNGVAIIEVLNTFYNDTNLTPGTYTYSVAAVDAAGNLSGSSTSATVTVPPPPATDTTAPTVPAGLTATLSGSTANLAWSPSTDSTGVTGYRVTRNGVAIIEVLNTFYNDTNLTPGTYTYSVAAVDAAGNLSGSSTSATVTVPPPPATDTTAPTVPAGLTATVVGSTVSLGWTPSTDNTGVTGYRVTRGGIVRGTTNDTTFLESGLAAGTHTYSVAAFDGAGNVSAESATTSATVAAAETLGFITPSVLPDATLGQSYLGYIVASDPPGPSTFQFKVVSGKVPPGTRFVENTLANRPEARVTGVPTARGTSSFTVEVRDGTGAVARRTFSLTVR